MKRRFIRVRRLLSLSVASLLAFCGPALAATVYVSNFGTDGGSCGSSTTPCRSITQGITNSAVGGKIVVGPGRYGDLDNDGTLGETGEEPLAACTGLDCMVLIDKEVTVTSSSGAFATVIDPGSNATVQATVAITVSGAQLGSPNKGFTVSPPGAGLGFAVYNMNGNNVTISGNVVPLGDSGHSGIASYGSGTLTSGNRVTGGSHGILVYGADGEIAGNVVSGAGASGLEVVGSGFLLSGNVATDCRYGLYLDGTSMSVAKSSFVGNSSYGIAVEMGGSSATITASNIYGNDPATNCGLIAFVDSTVTVTDSWWGAATGPGADPADDSCDEGAGAKTPFATSALKVKVKGVR